MLIRDNLNCHIEHIPLTCMLAYNPDTGESTIEAVYLSEYYRNPSILSLLKPQVQAQILAKFAEKRNVYKLEGYN